MTHLLLYNQGILKEGTSHPHCSSEPCELHGCGNQHSPCTHMQSGCAVCTRLMRGTCMLTWRKANKNPHNCLYSISHVRNRYSVQVHLLTASFGWTDLTGNVFLYTNQQTSLPTHPHLFPRLQVSVGPAGLYFCLPELKQMILVRFPWVCSVKLPVQMNLGIFAYLIAPFKYFFYYCR